MSSYSLPPSLHYIDTQAATRYEESSGTEIAVTLRVDASVADTFDAWVEYMWIKSPMAKEVAPGTGRGALGHTRFLSKIGIEEQISSVGLPDDADASAVPSVQYVVTKLGAAPITDKIAFVRFVPDLSEEKPCTYVVWTIKLTLKAGASPAVAQGVTDMLVTGLRGFAMRFAAQASSPKL